MLLVGTLSSQMVQVALSRQKLKYMLSALAAAFPAQASQGGPASSCRGTTSPVQIELLSCSSAAGGGGGDGGDAGTGDDGGKGLGGGGVGGGLGGLLGTGGGGSGGGGADGGATTRYTCDPSPCHPNTSSHGQHEPSASGSAPSDRLLIKYSLPASFAFAAQADLL